MQKLVLRPSNFASPVTSYFSWGIKVRDAALLFISGVCALDSDGQVVGKGNIEVQTRKTIENLEIVLREGGATLKDIVKVTTYLTSINDFEAYKRVRSEYFKDQKDLPASTLVVVKSLFSQEVLIEIEAIAAI